MLHKDTENFPTRKVKVNFIETLQKVKNPVQNLSNKTVDIPSAKRSYASVVNPTTKGDKPKQFPCQGSEA